MDRVERPKQKSEFANEAELRRADAAPLQTITGRERSGDDQSGSPAARPRSEITGRHDAGSGANETVDGLTASEESARRAVEDVPVDGSAAEADASLEETEHANGEEADNADDTPVFDRASEAPRI
jgi:hypothetical protein